MAIWADMIVETPAAMALRNGTSSTESSRAQVEPITGSDTVDHYIPKSLDVRSAYEWSNYRFACARMNARKGVAAEVLDPFEVQDGWFQLELVRFQLLPAPGLPSELVARIETTIQLLGLNDEDCKQTRAR